MNVKNNYVLFSPIGTTDPISNYHDGAMLHIARKYRPLAIYLYFSKEMAALHRMDNRYVGAINLLGKKLGVIFKTKILIKSELEDVHLFDQFYKEYDSSIKCIALENPGSSILLNVSSGTPAMKSALQTLAAMSEGGNILPIQVATPEKKSNPRRDDIHSYDLVAEWECDEDNKENFEDRTEISTTLNLRAMIDVQSIIRHIETYDYHAALTLADGLPDGYLTDYAVKLLSAANKRILLDVSGVVRELSGTGCKFIPIEDSSLSNVAEYMLWLDIKLKRAEYADFIRGITPIIADLLELYISKDPGIDIARYYKNPAKKSNREPAKKCLIKYKLDRDEPGKAILEALQIRFNGAYDDTKPCSSIHLQAIINHCSKNQHIKEVVNDLRTVEEGCRNMAAHEIISLTPDEISKMSNGFSPDKIMKLLFETGDVVGIHSSVVKGSYDCMNEQIKSAMVCK